MRRHLLHTMSALLAGALLAGCAAADETPSEDADAVVSALPSPPAADPSPAPTDDPTDEASQEATPSPSPSPTEPGTLDEADALAAAEARRASRSDCDDDFADQAHQVITTLDERMLVFVACFIGAYQANGELLVWDGAELGSIPVEQWQSGSVGDSAEVVGYVGADVDAGTVVNEVKYRGLGDCGLLQRWQFDGTSLVLEQAREQECGDEAGNVPPDQWPLVYER